MSQPFNRAHILSPPGPIDPEMNEIWVSNAFSLPRNHNLSSFERNRLFLNRDGGSFDDVSFLSGADSDGDSRTVIAADLFNRGRIDLLVRQIGGGGLLLYENNFQTVGNYLNVDAPVPGARIEVRANGLRQIQDVFSKSASYLSQSPLRCHFGLGNAEICDLSVFWPDGRITRMNSVPVNQHLHIPVPSTLSPRR